MVVLGDVVVHVPQALPDLKCLITSKINFFKDCHSILIHFIVFSSSCSFSFISFHFTSYCFIDAEPDTREKTRRDAFLFLLEVTDKFPLVKMERGE